MVGGSPVPLNCLLEVLSWHLFFFSSHHKSLEIWQLLTWHPTTFYNSCVTPGTCMWQQGVQEVRGTPAQSAAASWSLWKHGGWNPYWLLPNFVILDWIRACSVTRLTKRFHGVLWHSTRITQKWCILNVKHLHICFNMALIYVFLRWFHFVWWNMELGLRSINGHWNHFFMRMNSPSSA